MNREIDDKGCFYSRESSYFESLRFYIGEAHDQHS